MYGLGHGGIESILLVGLTVAGSLVLYVLLSRGFPVPIPADKLELVRKQFSDLTPGRSLLGGVERLFALCLQVGFSLLVMQAFRRNQLRWLGYAIALHFLVDLAAVMAAKQSGAILAEVVVGAFAVAVLVAIARLRGLEAAGPAPSPDAPVDAAKIT